MSDKTKMKPPYKDDCNRWLTVTLFVEQIESTGRTSNYGEPPFSLDGRPGYIDARATFLAQRDPTGYKWAKQYLGDYEHLKRLLEAPWFVKVYNRWLDELSALMRSEAISEIRAISVDPEVSDSQRLAAAKYLSNREWEKADKPVAKRGRPSKEEINGKLREAVQMSEETREEFERAGLKLIKGAK